MKVIGFAKNSILFLLLAFGLVIVVITVILSTGESTNIQLSDEDTLKIRTRELLSAEVSRATALANEGQHTRAARIMINVAGAQRVLLHCDPDRKRPGNGWVIERMALQQLSLVGKDRAYREFLRSLYPEWDR